MTEKEIKELFNNEEFINTILLPQTKGFFISKNKPVYTLKECLENLND